MVKVRENLTVESTKALVHAFGTCRLKNCNSLLTVSPKYLITKLQRIQNCAARHVAQRPRAAHVSPILKELHWLPVDQRIVFKVLLLTYKAINNLAPSYITQLLVRYNQLASVRSAGKSLLEVHRVRLKTKRNRALLVAAPKLWSDLLLKLKLRPSVVVVKSPLKTHLCF